MRILTGEAKEDFGPDHGKDKAAQALGKKGGTAQAKSMTPKRRTEIAKKAAEKRWGRSMTKSSAGWSPKRSALYTRC
jgi:hypothetical protein